MEKINIKNIIRVLSLILVLLFFLPAFMVSCSGQTEDISAFDCMSGISMDMGGTTSKVTDPVPVLALLLVLPLVIFVIWFIGKESSAKAKAAIVTVASIANLVIWILLKEGASKEAENNLCSLQTRYGYTCSLVLSVVIAILGAIVVLGFVDANRPLLSSNLPAPAPGGPVPAPSEGGWLCPSCGKTNKLTSKFCAGCGSPKPVQVVTAGQKFCPACGAKLNPGNKFCVSCGNPVNTEVPAPEPQPVYPAGQVAGAAPVPEVPVAPAEPIGQPTATDTLNNI